MKIMLVDDHSLFAEGLSTLLADLDPTPQVIICRSCEEALKLRCTDNIELILLDYHLPGMSKLTALNAIRNHFLNARIIVVSAEDNSAVIRSIIEAGAAGFIPKTATYAVLTAALNLVAAGGTYLPSETLEEYSDHAPSLPKPTGSEPQPEAQHGLSILSKRQQEVLMLVVQGLPNKVIAHRLGISEHTVKAHVSASFKVLGVRNRTEAVYVTARLQQ